MAYENAIRFILSEGEALAHALLDDFVLRKEENYPSRGPGPLQFLKFLEDFTQSTLTDLGQLRTLVDGSPVDFHEDIYREAKRSNFVLRYISELLDLVSGAAAEDLPFPLVPSSERELRKFHETSCIIFKTSLEYTYEILIISKAIMERLAPSNIVKNHNWPLIVVTIPASPIADTTDHVLIAHEIGHAIYDSIEAILPSSQPSTDEINTIARMSLVRLGPQDQASVDTFMNTPIGREVVASIGRRVSAVVEHWIEEIFADTIGALLLGPAFFYAYVAFLGAFMPLDQASDTHPTTRVRTTNILAVLHSTGYMAGVVAPHGASVIESWEQALAELPRERFAIDEVADAVWKLAEKIVNSTLASVRQAALEVASPMSYASTRYKEDIAEFVRLLREEHIPPIERRTPQGKKEALSLAAIVNIGWEAVLGSESTIRSAPKANGLGDMSSAMAAFRNRLRLNEMILRAVELGEVRRSWEEADGDSIGSQNP